METDFGVTLNPNINTILSDEGGRRVELIHNADDPSMWIIRSSHTRLGFKMKTSTTWFQSKPQALAFAHKETEQHRQMNSVKRNIITQ